MGSWVLVRHGETLWNAAGRVQGHTPIPLSARGLLQAQDLRRRLHSLPISTAYASDLSRCVQTAEVVLQERPVPLHLSKDLREQAYGRWEGSTYKELEVRDPARYAEMLRGDNSFAPPGGESLARVAERVSSFIGAVKASCPEETVLIVGHGGSLRAMLIGLLGLPLAAVWRFRFDPASVSILDVYPDSAVLRLLNDTAHLRDGQ